MAAGVPGNRGPAHTVVTDCMQREPCGPEQPAARDHGTAERIGLARAEAALLAESLTRQWEGVVEASALTANDDEHDPEGSTVAYERERIRATRDQVYREIDALDRAARRLRDGSYRICERCGGPIAEARLVARPTAATCIGCASRAGG